MYVYVCMLYVMCECVYVFMFVDVCELIYVYDVYASVGMYI